MYRRRSSVPGLRSLTRDTEGSALLETVIAFPALLLFMLVVMEMSLLYNGKQLANYAAFSAARTAAVNGVDSTAKTHFAAAMAMSSIASANNASAEDILRAYGLTDPNQTVAALCSIPGFQGDNAKWLARLANAYVRTGLPLQLCPVRHVLGQGSDRRVLRHAHGVSVLQPLLILGRCAFHRPAAEQLAVEHHDPRPRGNGLLGRVATWKYEGQREKDEL